MLVPTEMLIFPKKLCWSPDAVGPFPGPLRLESNVGRATCLHRYSKICVTALFSKKIFKLKKTKICLLVMNTMFLPA